MPLGHGGARMAHHVFPVLYLRGATFPGKINLWDTGREWPLSRTVSRETDVICKGVLQGEGPLSLPLEFSPETEPPEERISPAEIVRERLILTLIKIKQF